MSSNAPRRASLSFLTRRSMLQASAGAACACALGGCSGGQKPLLTQDVTVSLDDYPTLKQTGGEVELRTNVTGYNYPIFVRNEGGDFYLALSGWCDHEGCAVRRSGTGFVCPCHDARFAADGALLSGPARSGLIAFDTQLSGTSLTILANG